LDANKIVEALAEYSLISGYGVQLLNPKRESLGWEGQEFGNSDASPYCNIGINFKQWLQTWISVADGERLSCSK